MLAEVLSALAKCNRVPRPNNCDDVAGEVLTWYECGDSALLDPLLLQALTATERSPICSEDSSAI